MDQQTIVAITLLISSILFVVFNHIPEVVVLNVENDDYFTMSKGGVCYINYYDEMYKVKECSEILQESILTVKSFKYEEYICGIKKID